MIRKSNFDKRRGLPQNDESQRLKRPQEGEVLGTVSKIAGAARFMVRCTDGKERLCSIPGRLRRRFWIKEGDVVIVKPWIVEGDQRGDVMWRYSQMDISRLRAAKLI